MTMKIVMQIAFLMNVKSVQGIASFSQLLQQLLEGENIDNVQCSAWTPTHRATL